MMTVLVDGLKLYEQATICSYSFMKRKLAPLVLTEAKMHICIIFYRVTLTTHSKDLKLYQLSNFESHCVTFAK